MRYAVSAFLLFWAVAAGAQQPPAGNSNELVVNLYNQLQDLQNEVLTLRGMVEEQGNQLRRLQTESRDRYMDLDSRLQGGAGAAPAAGGIPAPLNTPDAGATPPLNAPGATPAPLNAPGGPGAAPLNAPVAGAAPTPLGSPQPLNAPAATAPAGGAAPALGGGPQALELDEQETYRTALNLLLEQSKPADAIVQFQSYIDRFPTGRLFTNALYWQGEAFILVGRNQEAVDVFGRLLREYPQDAKAPGAMLKSGVALDRLGERDAAESMWRNLKDRFPTATAEINAAQDYLKR
jgi:tol-pal system protein YbgF